MTDRELLELAAKAAGYCVSSVEEMSAAFEDGTYYTHDRGYPAADRDGSHWWNPLLDDGDALRLAVALGMNVEITDSYVFACSVGNFSEPAKPDRNAAVRRAIVRAAAAMASNGETV